MEKKIEEIPEKGLQVNSLIPRETAARLLKFAGEREWARAKSVVKLIQVGLDTLEKEQREKKAA